VWLDNNNFLGPVPALKAANFTFSGNAFCADKSGFLRCGGGRRGVMGSLISVKLGPNAIQVLHAVL
jgi:hypothetical protein